MRRLPFPSLLTLAAIAGLVAVSCMPAPLSRLPAPEVGGCSVARVIDGDTVDMTCRGDGRFRARLTGYDTPESHEPRCPAEAQAAAAATARLHALVDAASTVAVRLGDFDRYGRRLVALRLDGQEVGATLIAEGLAVPYSAGPQIDWCARLT
jgi:endonuclease YncB( thermonuclease family)